jgi:hypothetical protein
VKITKPPSPTVAAAHERLADLAKPVDAAAEQQVVQATLGRVAEARADALSYTAPGPLFAGGTAVGRGQRTALVTVALQDVDAALAAQGKPAQARGVLGARLQEATKDAGTDVLQLLRASLNDHARVAAQLASSLGLSDGEAKDLVDAFHDLAAKGAAARGQVEATVPARAQALVELRAAQVVKSVQDALDLEAPLSQALADDDRDTGITPLLLSNLERLERDLPKTSREEFEQARDESFARGDFDVSMYYLDEHADPRTKQLVDGIRALVGAVREQVKNDPVPAW